MEGGEEVSIEDLPNELLERIFMFVQEKLTLLLVCSEWSKLVYSSFTKLSVNVDFLESGFHKKLINLTSLSLQLSLESSYVNIDTITNLRNLSSLCVSGANKAHELKEIIEVIPRLRDLSSLDVSGTITDYTAISFSSLYNLESLSTDLDLVYNSYLLSLLRRDSDYSRLQMPNFTRLTQLHFKHCYGFLFDDLDKATTLTSLSIREYHFPLSEVLDLTRLTSLSLTSCTAIPPLPNLLESLTQLRVLRYQGAITTEIPPEISLLTNLTELSLAQNCLTVIGREIFLLTKLKSIDLSNNNIYRIPQEVGQLVDLRELIVDLNPISSLPKEVLHLSNLDTIHPISLFRRLLASQNQ